MPKDGDRAIKETDWKAVKSDNEVAFVQKTWAIASDNWHTSRVYKKHFSTDREDWPYQQQRQSTMYTQKYTTLHVKGEFPNSNNH